MFDGIKQKSYNEGYDAGVKKGSQSGFSNGYKNGHEIGKKEGLVEGRKEVESREFQLQQETNKLRVGSPLICIASTQENPIIGFGDSIQPGTTDKASCLIIHDFISGLRFPVPSASLLFEYSEQKFDLILSLQPSELWLLLNASKIGGHQYYEGNYKKERDDSSLILKKLEINGFFKKWDLFKENNYTPLPPSYMLKASRN